MHRTIAVILIALLLSTTPLSAEECSVATYEVLVIEGKIGDGNRDWKRSSEIYSKILDECRTLVKSEDLVKV